MCVIIKGNFSITAVKNQLGPFTCNVNTGFTHVVLPAKCAPIWSLSHDVTPFQIQYPGSSPVFPICLSAVSHVVQSDLSK